RPVTVIPPPPKPGVTPVAPQRVTVLQPTTAAPKVSAPPPAALRAPESSPALSKPGQAPSRLPVAAETPVSLAPKPSAAPPVAKPPQPAIPSKPPVEAAPPREAVAREIPATVEPVS